MMMDQKDLKFRTRSFALCIVRMFSQLPTSTEAQVMGKQVLISGTSVGAYYREANRSRSDAEFIAKIGDCLKELDETNRLLAIFTTVSKNARAPLKSVMSELSARRMERRNRSVRIVACEISSTTQAPTIGLRNKFLEVSAKKRLKQ